MKIVAQIIEQYSNIKFYPITENGLSAKVANEIYFKVGLVLQVCFIKGGSKSNTFYFNMLAHNVRCRC